MLPVKKLSFAIPFIILLCGFFWQLNYFLGNPGFVLTLNMDIFIQLIFLTALILGSSLFFVIFITLSPEYRYALPVIGIAAIPAVLLLPRPLSLLMGSILVIFLTTVYLLLLRKLKSYLNFQPTSILNPVVKQTAVLIIILSSLAFYFSAGTNIKQNGFAIPDSLIDTALKIAPQQNFTIPGENAGLPSLTPEQIDFLEKNPEAIRQAGLDPKILKTIKEQQANSQTPLSTQDIIKSTVKAQFQEILTPYQNYIAIILAVVLLFTLQTLQSLLALTLSPLILFIFWILEETKFVHYEVETREVKKLVV